MGIRICQYSTFTSDITPINCELQIWHVTFHYIHRRILHSWEVKKKPTWKLKAENNFFKSEFSNKCSKKLKPLLSADIINMRYISTAAVKLKLTADLVNLVTYDFLIMVVTEKVPVHLSVVTKFLCHNLQQVELWQLWVPLWFSILVLTRYLSFTRGT